MEVLEREYQRRRSSAVSRSDSFSNERYSDVVHGKIAEIILERLEQRVHLHKLKSCLS